MPVDLKTLLKVAPFPEEQRQKVLANFDKLTEEQKLRLTNVAWTAITQKYYAQLRYKVGMLLLEIRQGKKKYNPEDFKKIEEETTREFVNKLKGESKEISLEEIREQLRAYGQAAKAKMPPAQPSSSPQPPPSAPEKPPKATVS